jgi:hypothetical protein
LSRFVQGIRWCETHVIGCYTSVFSPAVRCPSISITWSRPSPRPLDPLHHFRRQCVRARNSLSQHINGSCRNPASYMLSLLPTYVQSRRAAMRAKFLHGQICWRYLINCAGIWLAVMHACVCCRNLPCREFAKLCMGMVQHTCCLIDWNLRKFCSYIKKLWSRSGYSYGVIDTQTVSAFLFCLPCM